MRRILVSLIIGVMVFPINQIALAQEKVEKIYHFIFELENDVSASENEAIMDAFREKMDILGIDRCIIKRESDKFIVTAKTDIDPAEIVDELQLEEFPVTLMFITNFVCDVAQNKEHFNE